MTRLLINHNFNRSKIGISTLTIKGTAKLTVTFDKIEIIHTFLCGNKKLLLALLGYYFLRKKKVDILTSANCLLIQNVPIITHTHKSRKTVGVILTANSIIEPYSENVVEGQRKKARSSPIKRGLMHSRTKSLNRRQSRSADRDWIYHLSKLNANPSLECMQLIREPQGLNKSWRPVAYRT